MDKQILALLKENNKLLKEILAILSDEPRNFSMNVLANLISEGMLQR